MISEHICSNLLYTSYHCDIRRIEVISCRSARTNFWYCGKSSCTRAAPNVKIVEATGLSLGSVNSAAKSLSAAGLIADGDPTEVGATALGALSRGKRHHPGRGLSSRFAPISYEKPKGLLKVRGEVLSSARSSS